METVIHYCPEILGMVLLNDRYDSCSEHNFLGVIDFLI